MMIERVTLGLKEVAALTGVSHWTLRKYIRQGQLQAVRIGRRVLVEPAELVRFIAQCKEDAWI
jgi:excisionase family DNA binding protein